MNNTLSCNVDLLGFLKHTADFCWFFYYLYVFLCWCSFFLSDSPTLCLGFGNISITDTATHDGYLVMCDFKFSSISVSILLAGWPIFSSLQNGHYLYLSMMVSYGQEVEPIGSILSRIEDLDITSETEKIFLPIFQHMSNYWYWFLSRCCFHLSEVNVD